MARRQGNDPAFVNTAWTVKVIRGVLMWLVLCPLAAPLASLYGEPMLAELLPVAGLAAVIAGLGSTNIASADRNLGIARTTVIDVGSYAFGLLVTIVWAWIDRTVWSRALTDYMHVPAPLRRTPRRAPTVLFGWQGVVPGGTYANATALTAIAFNP